MTRTARIVLSDCTIALRLLESESDPALWRVHWVGAPALIRAVGHVLDKVDGKEEPFATLGKEAYQRWKCDQNSNKIFWEFINKERNNILKEYVFNVHPNEEVKVLASGRIMNPATGKIHEMLQVFPIGENIYRPILDGYREGDDARDVYQDAISWWSNELFKLEKAAGEKWALGE